MKGLLLLWLLILPCAVSAQSYVGLEAGYFWERFDTRNTYDFDNTTSWGVFYGNRISDYLAVETIFERNIRDVDVDVRDRSGDYVVNSLTVGTKLFRPFYEDQMREF